MPSIYSDSDLSKMRFHQFLFECNFMSSFGEHKLVFDMVISATLHIFLKSVTLSLVVYLF